MEPRPFGEPAMEQRASLAATRSDASRLLATEARTRGYAREASGPSRSSNDPMPPKASNCRHDAGWSNEPSTGSTAMSSCKRLQGNDCERRSVAYDRQRPVALAQTGQSMISTRKHYESDSKVMAMSKALDAGDPNDTARRHRQRHVPEVAPRSGSRRLTVSFRRRGSDLAHR